MIWLGLIYLAGMLVTLGIGLWVSGWTARNKEELIEGVPFGLMMVWPIAVMVVVAGLLACLVEWGWAGIKNRKQ